MRFLHGRRIYVDSVGVRPEPIDPFAVAVLEELGIGLAEHQPKSFDELEDDYFDLVISLSPEAHHRAVELTRTSASEIEFWPTLDPTLTEGHRDARLAAYRALRDDLLDRLRARFPPDRAPVMVCRRGAARGRDRAGGASHTMVLAASRSSATAVLQLRGGDRERAGGKRQRLQSRLAGHRKIEKAKRDMCQSIQQNVASLLVHN